MKWVAVLAVAAAAIGLCSAVGSCPGEFINISSDPVLLQCVAILTSPDAWHHMLTKCESMGASLAKVTGDDHNNIYNYIRNTLGLMDRCYWIGGTDEYKEGEWKWVSDNSSIPLGTPHWDPCEQEPDGGYGENQLAICPDKFYFKDHHGGLGHYAICQKFI